MEPEKPIEPKELQSTKVAKLRFLEALVKSFGVISQAAILANVNRSTVYKWMETDKKFKAKVLDVEDIAIDFAETKMFEGINNGDALLIKFYLERKGKKRGYVRSTELTGANGEALFKAYSGLNTDDV